MDPLAACLALGAAQLAVTLRFWLLLRRDRASPPSSFAPPASVVVACKGDGPGLEENARALQTQDYPGSWEVLFVTPSERDPAFARLKSLMGPRARLLASGRVPERCSGKIADLLFALERAAPSSEVLAFADADVRVGRSWLSELVAPLAEPSVGASTAAMLYVPERPGPWSFMRLAWMGAGIPYFELCGCVTGQSAAVRRGDFERLGVAELWSRSFMDDLSLAARVKSAGLRVRFATRAMPWSPEPCGLGRFLAQFNRWIAAFRVYAPGVWALGLLVTLSKAWLLWLGLRRPALLGALFGLDAANLLLLFSLYRAYLGGRVPVPAGAPWLAALSAPLLQAAYAVNFLASLRPWTVEWGGARYRVRAAQDVEVLERQA